MVTFEKNSDGSVVCKLDRPVKFKNDEHSRLTIPALKGKHLKSAPFNGNEILIGQLIDWANRIVEPIGLVDELEIPDAMQIATEVASQLSKSPK